MTHTQNVEYEGHGNDAVQALFVLPGASSERVPAVLLIHEVFGIERHVEDLANRLAEEGFAVLAPDLWSREGRPGPEPDEADPAPAWSPDEIRAAVAGLPDRRALADLESGLAMLAGHASVDHDRMAALGFCMGGNYAFQLGCTSRRVAAVVDFYGRVVYPELSSLKPIQPLELALNLSCPLLCHFGSEDASIPAEHVARLETVLSQFAKSFEVATWEGAGHGFFNDTRGGYHGPSAQPAWDRTLRFLREQLEHD